MLNKVKTTFINIILKIQTIKAEAYGNYAHKMW